VVATTDVQQLQKKRQLQNQNVGDCLHPYSSVIAIAEKKQVKRCDCNKPVKKSSMS
jgi:hypothetical protein